MMPMGQGPDLDRISTEAIREVLTTQFRLSVFAASSDEVGWASVNPHGLTGSVSLEGPEIRGEVRLQVPESWLSTLNASLDPVSPDPADRASEMWDLASELCNMVAGRIGAGIAAAGHICTLSTPDVTSGPQNPVEAGPGAKRSHTHWTCAGETLTLTVWIK